MARVPRRVRRAGLVTVLVVGLASTTPVLAGAAGAGVIGWHPCSIGSRYGARCGTVPVPRDWRRPDGPRIGLALLRVPATGRSTGTVVVDSEDLVGYGGGQLDFFSDKGDNYLSRLRRTHARKDIVVFDPRGMGHSAGARCSRPGHDPAVPSFPETGSGYRKLARHNAAVARGCRGNAGLLAHMGLAEQVRDVEAIRAALGVDRLDWLGQAYGGALGAGYAARYPGRVGRMVLDAPVDLRRSPARRAVDAAGAEEAAFVRFTRWCRTTSAARCGLHGRDPGAVLDRAAARADAGGVRGSAPVDRPLTGAEIRTAVGQFLLGYPMAWPALAAGLARAADDGDGGGLVPYVAMTFAGPDYTVARWQTCPDGPVPGPRALAAESALLHGLAPHTGGASLAWDSVTGCVGWAAPHPPRPNPPAAGRTPTVLVTATTGDPITPYGWARDVARHLPGSRVLTARVDGHNALDNSTCAAAAIDNYLADGRTAPATCRS